MIDIKELMTLLSIKHKLFKSERDFQNNLGTLIKEKYPNYVVNYEVSAQMDDSYIFIDIVVEDRVNNKVLPIELKYHTTKLNYLHNNEEYSLKTHSAEDLLRYDFNKDIMRLEKLKETRNDVIYGYAILLSNTKGLWRNNLNSNVGDYAFRIHNKKNHSGLLCWNLERVSSGTTKDREACIELKNNYDLVWKQFSKLDEHNGEFKYLTVKVG